MALEYDFDKGYDPTSASTISAAQLLQMISQALPKSTKGILIYQDTTPDLASNTRYSGYLWIRPSDNPKIIRYWDTGSSSWTVVTIPANGVVTASITDGAVTLAKLGIGAGTANQLIRVNAGATAFEFFTFANAAGSVTLAMFTAPGGGNAFKVIRVNAGSTGYELATFTPSTDLPAASIPVTKLAFSVPNSFIVTNAAGTAAEWALFDSSRFLVDYSIPVTKITVPVGSPNKALFINNAGNDWTVRNVSQLYPIIPALLVVNFSNAVSTPTVNVWNTVDVSSLGLIYALSLSIFIRFTDPAIQHAMAIEFRSSSLSTDIRTALTDYSQVNGNRVQTSGLKIINLLQSGATRSFDWRITYVDNTGANAALPAVYDCNMYATNYLTL